MKKLVGFCFGVALFAVAIEVLSRLEDKYAPVDYYSW